MKQCPFCQCANEDDSLFCRQCGKPLSAPQKRRSRGGIIAVIAAVIIIGLLIVLFTRSSRPEPQRPSATLSVSPSEAPAAAPTPTPTPVPTPAAPSIDDIAGCDKRILVPEEDSWLDSYETKYVKSRYGTCIYLIWGPSKDYDHFDSVEEASAVTELARQGDYSLVIAPGQRIGWCKSALIVKEYYGAPSASPAVSPSPGTSGGDCCPGCPDSPRYLSPEYYYSAPNAADLCTYNCPFEDFDPFGAFVISIDQYAAVVYSEKSVGTACIGDTVDLRDRTATIYEIRPDYILLDSGDKIIKLSNGYWYAVDANGCFIVTYACESPFYVSDNVKVIDRVRGTTEYGTDALVAAFEAPYDSYRYMYYYTDGNAITCVERLSGAWAP